ncbi:MAG: NADPH-dependent curcumin reductase CurA, partial [Bacteroidia bacterium]
MSPYTSIKLAARPSPGPITADLFEVEHQEIPTPGPGQVLVKQTH